jgi:hypothetical protein
MAVSAGLLIGDRHVLTAAHVVTDVVAVTVRGPNKVVLPADLDLGVGRRP